MTQALRHTSKLTDEQKSAMQELRTIAEERISRSYKLKTARERYEATQRALNYAEMQLHCTSDAHQESDMRRADGARMRHEDARDTLNALLVHFAELETEAKARERELHSIL